MDDAEFARTVTGTVVWADEFMGADHPANATRVLTLPFGIGPTPDDHPSKYQLMTGVMNYEGHQIQLTGVLELAGGSSENPWSLAWDPFSIPRLPVQDDVLDLFKEVHLESENPYYTSDGNVDTVTVPWPLPKAQWGKLNKAAVHESVKLLVKYDPDNGQPVKHHMHGVPAGTSKTWQREFEVAAG
jgi:hypothetical protein